MVLVCQQLSHMVLVCHIWSFSVVWFQLFFNLSILSFKEKIVAQAYLQNLLYLLNFMSHWQKPKSSSCSDSYYIAIIAQNENESDALKVFLCTSFFIRPIWVSWRQQTNDLLKAIVWGTLWSDSLPAASLKRSADHPRRRFRWAQVLWSARLPII